MVDKKLKFGYSLEEFERLREDAEKWRDHKNNGGACLIECKRLEDFQHKAKEYEKVVERAKKQLSYANNARERCIKEDDVEGVIFSGDVARIICRVMGWKEGGVSVNE